VDPIEDVLRDLGDHDASGYDAVVNTSAVGVKPCDPLLFDASHPTPDITASKIVMSPETSLGKSMLEHQVKRLESLLKQQD